MHLALFVIHTYVHLDLIEREARVHPPTRVEDRPFLDPIRWDPVDQISPLVSSSVRHEIGSQSRAFVLVGPQCFLKLIPQLVVRLGDSALRFTRAL